MTVSPEGQIAIPKAIREALDLSEGSKLTVEVEGQKIVLSKEAAWERLRGAGADITKDFLAFRKAERELEDSRS